MENERVESCVAPAIFGVGGVEEHCNLLFASANLKREEVWRCSNKSPALTHERGAFDGDWFIALLTDSAS